MTFYTNGFKETQGGRRGGVVRIPLDFINNILQASLIPRLLPIFSTWGGAWVGGNHRQGPDIHEIESAHLGSDYTIGREIFTNVAVFAIQLKP